ncbi:MAG: methyltransferase domain-containing protein [Candidatus Moraniibacteriota bacterium]
MRERFISLFSDPVDSTPVTLSALKREGDHVIDGLFQSASNWYPIIAGVPRFLIGELRQNLLQEKQAFFQMYALQLPESARSEWQRAIDAIPDLDAFLAHQKKTGESFAYEWKYIYRENDYEKQNFLHFLSPFVKEADLTEKRTLDIGCGSGRFTKWAALSGAEMAIGSDLGESVAVAYEMTKELPNACIIQADIYAMPFHGAFDFAYSIGVLHHLPEPKQGFLALPKVLKQGGRFLIWVYNRRDNARALYSYEPLRAVLRHLPKPILYKLCYLPGAIVHGINLFGRWIADIGFPDLEKSLPFAYYRHFPFNMKLNDAFDVLATPKSNYYFVEEIENWFREARLREIKSFEHPEAGITCTGTKGA